jgi:excisionase family DNA binding protein
MTTEEKIKALEHLLRKCPDVLTVIGVANWTHMGKNTIHALIKSGKLTAFQYRGAYLISKADLIDYLAATSDDEPDWEKRFKGRTRHGK